jgi:hypothetical protein
MKKHNVLILVALAGMACVVGCAREARDTTGFATTDSVVVNAGFEEAWIATREVLQQKDFEIDTRDKRGRFVAYSNPRRQLLVPYRQQYTITLDEESAGSTRVTVQTLRQVYGVTLLTYPGWHARKTTDNSVALEILEGVQAYLNGETSPAEPAAPAAEESPA